MVKSGTHVCLPVGREVGKGWERKSTKFYLEKAGQDSHGETLSSYNQNVRIILQPWLADVYYQAFSSQRQEEARGRGFKRRAL